MSLGVLNLCHLVLCGCHLKLTYPACVPPSLGVLDLCHSVICAFALWCYSEPRCSGEFLPDCLAVSVSLICVFPFKVFPNQWTTVLSLICVTRVVFPVCNPSLLFASPCAASSTQLSLHSSVSFLPLSAFQLWKIQLVCPRR